MALLPFVWPCACHSPGCLCEKRPSRVFTTSSQLAAQIGPQTGTSSITVACFATCPRWRCPLSKIAACQRVLKVSLESEGPATKRCATQRAKPSLEEDEQASLQFTCVSRIYHRPCSNYTVFAGPTVNLRDAHLKHLTRTVAHCTL